ncbi:hypothetical protein C8Q75DRAFT_807353 [Abortiporus biennis]|nr:hypothetical protein C8Q75DRAFT_807353 [Abortiporus biennis]
MSSPERYYSPHDLRSSEESSHPYSDVEGEQTGEEYDSDELGSSTHVRNESVFQEKGKRRASPERELDDDLPTGPAEGSSKKDRAWAELDLSLAVALVAPIGNWLTGSDHVKNLFLILMLIFYLHQLIEVPWQLYHASMSRESKRRFAKDAVEISKLAASELRRQELFYLAFTVVSPLLGAALIRYVLAALAGVDNLSWFSTTLFVLATGIRPWSHLISRLRQRTQHLHDAVHYPSHDSQAYHNIELEKKLRTILRRIDALEDHVEQLQEKTAKTETLQEVCDDLSEAVGNVERSLNRQERKLDGMKATHDARITVVEQNIVQLEERRKFELDLVEAKYGQFTYRLFSPSSTYVNSLLSLLRQLSDKVRDFVAPYLRTFLRDSDSDRVVFNGGPSVIKMRHMPASSVYPDLQSSQYPSRLETIPEADDSDSEDTFVSEKDPKQDTDGSSPSRSPNLDEKRERSKTASRPSLRRELSYTSKMYGIAGDLVAWPYRSAVKVLVMISPPVQKLFF